MCTPDTFIMTTIFLELHNSTWYITYCHLDLCVNQCFIVSFLISYGFKMSYQFIPNALMSLIHCILIKHVLLKNNRVYYAIRYCIHKNTSNLTFNNSINENIFLLFNIKRAYPRFSMHKCV